MTGWDIAGGLIVVRIGALLSLLTILAPLGVAWWLVGRGRGG